MNLKYNKSKLKSLIWIREPNHMSYFLGPLKLISVPSSNSYMVKIGNEVVAPLKLKFYVLMINSANVRKTLRKKNMYPS